MPASSIPPAMQRIKAIVVGKVMIWIARLRRDVAVARLVTMFAIPDVGKKLLLPRTWNETSSVLQVCQHAYNV